MHEHRMRTVQEVFEARLDGALEGGFHAKRCPTWFGKMRKRKWTTVSRSFSRINPYVSLLLDTRERFHCDGRQLCGVAERWDVRALSVSLVAPPVIRALHAICDNATR